MKIAIMQPYLFPYIGYFQLINSVDKFILLDDVNFINRGWINRNKILVNGQPKLISFPLRNASQNKLINEMEIISDHTWITKFMRTLHHNYGKAPFFDKVIQLIGKIVLNQEKNLSQYIYVGLLDIIKYLGIKTIIVSSSAKYNTTSLKAEQKILNICLQEGATAYINPIGGTELYSKQFFLENAIDLFFLRSKEIRYDQNIKTFVPSLSIIDAMMFNSPEFISETMLNEYDLL